MKNAVIYLSGPMNDSNDPERWRTDIKEANPIRSIEFLDPYEPKGASINDQIALLTQSDGILVHYEPRTEMAEPMADMQLGNESGKPVVMWTGRYRQPKDNLNEWYHYYCDSIQWDGRDALNKILTLI